MQLLVIEYARHVAGLPGAHTVEVNPHTLHPVIATMEEQKKKLEEGNYGGSMRLGSYPCVLKKGTISYKAYKEAKFGKEEKLGYGITERHRHRQRRRISQNASYTFPRGG